MVLQEQFNQIAGRPTTARQLLVKLSKAAGNTGAVVAGKLVGTPHARVNVGKIERHNNPLTLLFNAIGPGESGRQPNLQLRMFQFAGQLQWVRSRCSRLAVQPHGLFGKNVLQ